MGNALPFELAYRENIKQHPKLTGADAYFGGDAKNVLPRVIYISDVETLIRVDAGTGTVEIGGHLADLRPGTILRVRPGRSYRVTTSQEDVFRAARVLLH